MAVIGKKRGLLHGIEIRTAKVYCKLMLCRRLLSGWDAIASL